jgi:hypothetical protein
METALASSDYISQAGEDGPSVVDDARVAVPLSGNPIATPSEVGVSFAYRISAVAAVSPRLARAGVQPRS